MIGDIKNILTLGASAGNTIWNKFLHSKRYIRFDPDEGFKINHEVKKKLMESGKIINGGSTSSAVQDRAAFLVSLVCILNDLNKIYKNTIDVCSDDNMKCLKDAILFTCDFRSNAKEDELVNQYPRLFKNQNNTFGI